MVRRSLTYIAAGLGMLVALVIGLGIAANVLTGAAALLLSIPLYAVVLTVAIGGVGVVVWLLSRRG